MADTAQYWWCSIKSLLKNRDMELTFFASYLHDRVLYSYQLGLIDRLPSKIEVLLTIGDEITFRDVEKLLKEKAELMKNVQDEFVCLETTDEHGNTVWVINPNLTPEMREEYEKRARDKGIRVVQRIEELPPMVRGDLLEEWLMEKYPSIRWNFPWNRYIVVGVPDGITKKFVYEFKHTRNDFLLSFVKTVALAQADLYGFFFRRKNKRVQIHVLESNKTHTFEEPVDTKRALETLKRFKGIEEGESPVPPKSWKCRNCEFTSACPLAK
jgi:CRISPR/Cas system-associated exonuclease Cas4 (RecB family)